MKILKIIGKALSSSYILEGILGKIKPLLIFITIFSLILTIGFADTENYALMALCAPICCISYFLVSFHDHILDTIEDRESKRNAKNKELRLNQKIQENQKKWDLRIPPENYYFPKNNTSKLDNLANAFYQKIS